MLRPIVRRAMKQTHHGPGSRSRERRNGVAYRPSYFEYPRSFQ